MIITISGNAGSGKSTVAKLLAKKLNIKHYSIGDFMREIAQENSMSLLELSKVAEKEGWVDKKLDEKQIALGKKEDNFVIDSRIGFHFIPQSKKVFLNVDLEESAKRILKDARPSEKENTSFEKTVENIKRRRESERDRYTKYYSIDYLDMNNYDLAVDTTSTPPEKVVEKILEFLEKGD